jgi:hypothetical protein
MYREALKLQTSRKFVIQGVLFFALFILIYTIVDSLNMSYGEMAETYGAYLPVINIATNVVMAFLSALLMNLSTAMVSLKGREGLAGNVGFLSVLFGILTYGCTSCVIAFFASVGIAFSVVALPLAGFPYKLIAVLLILLGHLLMYREIQHGRCKVNLDAAK